MRLPRKFIWLEDDDDSLAHFTLEKNTIYKCGSISTGLLTAWAEDGKIKFVEDTDDIPRQVVIQVDDISIPFSTAMELPGAKIKGRR